MPESQYPERGDFVVVKIIRVLDYGAFAELLEYPNTQGFIHISQVASRWIKNIRNFVREGQVKVAMVLAVDTEKRQLELSLTKVEGEVQKRKLEEFQQVKRGRMLLELVAKRRKMTFEKVWKELAEPLVEEHGTFMEGLKEISLGNKGLLEKVPGPWREELEALAKDNVKLPRKTVKGIFELRSLAADGVQHLRNALLAGEEAAKGKEARLYYLGGGKYALEATAIDYKKAEKILEAVRESVLARMKGESKALFTKTE